MHWTHGQSNQITHGAPAMTGAVLEIGRIGKAPHATQLKCVFCQSLDPAATYGFCQRRVAVGARLAPVDRASIPGNPIVLERDLLAVALMVSCRR